MVHCIHSFTYKTSTAATQRRPHSSVSSDSRGTATTTTADDPPLHQPHPAPAPPLTRATLHPPASVASRSPGTLPSIRPWRDRRLVSYRVPSLSSSLRLSAAAALSRFLRRCQPGILQSAVRQPQVVRSVRARLARCRRQIPHPSAEVEVHARAAPLELAGKLLIGGVRRFSWDF